jgi:hypothetical protein
MMTIERVNLSQFFFLLDRLLDVLISVSTEKASTRRLSTMEASTIGYSRPLKLYALRCSQPDLKLDTEILTRKRWRLLSISDYVICPMRIIIIALAPQVIMQNAAQILYSLLFFS